MSDIIRSELRRARAALDKEETRWRPKDDRIEAAWWDFCCAVHEASDRYELSIAEIASTAQVKEELVVALLWNWNWAVTDNRPNAPTIRQAMQGLLSTLYQYS